MSLLRKKRIFYLLLSFALVVGLFALRIAWIQTASALKAVTVGGKTINELAVRQREESIELDPGRGHIFDRNGKPLTGEMAWTPILFPVRQLPEGHQLTSLATALGTTVPELRNTWERLERPYVWPKTGGEPGQPLRLNEEAARTLPRFEGLEVLPYMARYGPGERGNQWLGFVTQRPDVIRKLRERKHQPDYAMTLQVGASGLEKTLDGLLRGLGGIRAAYPVDGRKDPLGGMGTRVNATASRYYPLQIQTTVDDELQRKIEQLAAEMNVNEGAVVVLDAKTADIVSMVSLPFYDPHHVDPTTQNWGNKAVKAAVPGSIFKTVIAAAALEEHAAVPGEVFHCSGHYGKYGLSCWKEGGHGNITLEEGFAKSCNVVFATLGERLNAEAIARTASMLGIGRAVGWRDPAFLGGDALRPLDQEEKGAVFKSLAAADGGVLAQTAIGQRDVLVSPLQAANLVVTLLHGGQVTAPRLVSEIRYKDGSLLSELPVQASPSPAGQIRPRTAKRLLSWMRLVVTDGTGRALQQAKWPLAGKSGTAEILKNNRQLNHQWFIGYGPVDQPKYAVAVLVQNRPESSKHLAAELFRRIMDVLASSG
ncbi:peptidoglycan glycosyltransferase [Paenibacillus timonensis]|uniref:Peptidoglycan D,D-transpeptidase FtsI family protein n=1 Tax=Paenibacillus timonensis TaxID=225915 RepID=A0ABW3SB66_9BACL|nr:penicillin-binding transpeptidase domain-containing protein [Paenibacillus timonensis]MCH1640378.1 peptidoglycan glycosyltransferase [Paenibacillus timonensis]